MILYIHDNKTGGVIEQTCRTLGVEVLTAADAEKQQADASQVDTFLDRVDAMVLEITKPDQQVQFLLAHAILAQKPTLCLYGKNQPPRELLKYVKKGKPPRPIKTFSYTDGTIERSVANFIITHDPEKQEFDDIPSIKYTLRLTPRIERYLEWYSETHQTTKADRIRELLENAADESDDYAEGERVEQ